MNIKLTKNNFVIFIFINFLLLSYSEGNTIIIDPGHGGPTAEQWNGDNGDGAGTTGPNGLTEQWVNLQIANLLNAHCLIGQ